VADFSEILNQQQMQLVQAERTLLGDLNTTLSEFGAHENDRVLLSQLVEGLDELFLLVVVGEFNSGKSAFINALIGQTVLTEGVTPTTSQINILRYGPQAGQRIRNGDVLEVFHPAPFLREISLVDTPGTNAVIERHQELTEHFVPRSDLVIFVTSAERPFTQSEREFLTRVRNWGKKIVVVINKIDLLPDPAQRDQVLRFVHDQFVRLLEIEPAIFTVSGRQAIQAKQQGNNPQLWQSSGFGPLEDFIFRTLDQQSRIRLKLLNPVQVARRVLGHYSRVARDRLATLDQDARTVDEIERQLGVYSDDLRADFNARLSAINNLIYELNERGERFFDNVIRLTNLRQLIKTDQIKRDFEAEVIADTPRRIEGAVHELVDWLVERDLRLWRDVTTYLNQRRQQSGSENLLAQSGVLGNFSASRQALLREVTQKARAVVESYDQRREAEDLAFSTRQALAQATLTEIGAIGIGAALAALIGTAAADVTGLLFAVVVGGVGVYLIPARRRKAKAEFRRKIEDLRIRLTGVLRDQFEAEHRRSVEGVRDAIAPYSRFVRAEQQRFDDFAGRFEQFNRELNRFEGEIENVLASLPQPERLTANSYVALPEPTPEPAYPADEVYRPASTPPSPPSRPVENPDDYSPFPPPLTD
jgi:small GTP-binding protein